MKMKTKIKYFHIPYASIDAWIIPQKASAQGYVSYQVFYDDLSPYGTWVDVSQLRLCLVAGCRGWFYSLCHQRLLGINRCRMDMGIKLSMGMGAFSLWSLVH